jgi:hypothetical protein
MRIEDDPERLAEEREATPEEAELMRRSGGGSGPGPRRIERWLTPIERVQMSTDPCRRAIVPS